VLVVARVLDAVGYTGNRARDGVNDAGRPRISAAAERIQRRDHRPAGPAYAIALLERLVTEKCPLISA